MFLSSHTLPHGLSQLVFPRGTKGCSSHNERTILISVASSYYSLMVDLNMKFIYLVKFTYMVADANADNCTTNKIIPYIR